MCLHCRAPLLVADCTAKAKKPFSERGDPPKASVMNFEEDAVQKMAHVPLSASTTTRQTNEMEGIEPQLLERINESLWYLIQADESTNVDIKATFLCTIFFRSICTEICYNALSPPTNTTTAKLFKSSDDNVSEKQK